MAEYTAYSRNTEAAKHLEHFLDNFSKSDFSDGYDSLVTQLDDIAGEIDDMATALEDRIKDLEDENKELKDQVEELEAGE